MYDNNTYYIIQMQKIWHWIQKCSVKKSINIQCLLHHIHSINGQAISRNKMEEYCLSIQLLNPPTFQNSWIHTITKTIKMCCTNEKKNCFYLVKNIHHSFCLNFTSFVCYSLHKKGQSLVVFYIGLCITKTAAINNFCCFFIDLKTETPSYRWNAYLYYNQLEGFVYTLHFACKNGFIWKDSL